MKRFLVLAVMAVFLAGCGGVAARRGKSNVENRKVYGGSFDSIWKTTIDMLLKKKFSIMLAEKEQGLITTDWLTLDPHEYSSGIKGWKYRTYSEKTKACIEMFPAERGVEVVINVLNEDQIGLKGASWKKSRWITTNSNGKLEKELLSALSGSVTGTYAGIALSCDVREINAAKKESCVVTITVVDANGNIVKKNPLKEILLNIGGNARLVGNNPAKITKGIAKIKVQSTGVPGEIVVSASGSDLAVQPIKIMAVVPGMRTSQPEEEAQPEPPAEE